MFYYLNIHVVNETVYTVKIIDAVTVYNRRLSL